MTGSAFDFQPIGLKLLLFYPPGEMFARETFTYIYACILRYRI